MKRHSAFRVRRPGEPIAIDRVVEEIAVAFEYNGISHTVMLATPDDLEDFAVGFSLTEGIITDIRQIHDIEIEHSDMGIVLHIDIAGGPFFQLKQRRRSLAGRTGCGLCGAESLSQVTRDLAAVSASAIPTLEALHSAINKLPQHQQLQQETGAVHAACHMAVDGELSYIREDVGRHNALDKTLGSLARNSHPVEGGLLVTSRASFEMVQKTAALGYGLLAAVSAPTAAAIRLAQRLDLTLVGFLRGDKCVIYTHEHRLLNEPVCSEDYPFYFSMENRA